MDFMKEVSKEGIKISSAATKLAKWEIGDKVKLFISDGTMILFNKKMTAMELIKASQYLHEVSSDLMVELAKACGFCEDCDDCCPCKDCEWDEDVFIPDYLREEAGIPETAKLSVCVDEGNGAVIISAAEYDNTLADVPQIVIDILVNGGICIGALEEHLIKGDIVYGRED